MSDHTRGMRAIERLLRARFDVEIVFCSDGQISVSVENWYGGTGHTIAEALIDVVASIQFDGREFGELSDTGRDVIAAIFPPRERPTT